MKKKCVIIGGGFAGLTAACYLAKNNFQVEVLEASPKLGGRAYSLTEKETSTIIDNGQHIMMGCYKETLKFFDLINARENLIIQKRLKVNFVKENFNLVPLEINSALYPFNLLSALLKYKAISFKNRLLLLKFFVKLNFYSAKNLKNLTIYEWLEKENQNEEIRKAFWEILAVGALNTNIKNASAKIFADILKEIFFRGNNAASIIIPKLGLTETYCNHAVKYLEERGSEVNLLESVNDLKIENNEIKEIITNKRKISGFDFIVSAAPFFALQKFFPTEKHFENLNLNYACILSVHLWLKENKLKEKFYGLIDSPVHWVFNHENHITIVISDANEYINSTKDEILKLVLMELQKYFHIKEEDILSSKVIKEKRSTFIPSKQILENRPDSKIGINNFFLAGDWINTGLPSTIESAVKSGRMAAGEIIKRSKL